MSIKDFINKLTNPEKKQLSATVSNQETVKYNQSIESQVSPTGQVYDIYTTKTPGYIVLVSELPDGSLFISVGDSAEKDPIQSRSFDSAYGISSHMEVRKKKQ